MKLPMIGTAAALLFISASTQAATYTGNAELGFLASDGNTQSKAFNAGVALKRDGNQWISEAFAKAGFTSQDSDTTAERYNAGFKQSYKMNDSGYLFLSLDGEKDRFSGYRWRASETLGYGRDLIKNETTELNFEIGLGASQTEDQSGDSNSQGIAKGLIKYRYKLTKGATFGQDFKVETGEDNTYGESVSSLSMPLAEKLSFKASYTLKHNSAVASGSKHTDSYTAVSLGYDF